MPAPYQNAEAWTDALLEGMRQKGDPPADAVVAELFAAGEVQSVNALMRNLVDNEECIPDTLPAKVRDYLTSTGELPEWADPEVIAAGENIFWEWGPQLILLLHCYSLPFCYAARKGVQVLALTSRLSGNAARRIVETAQMLVDVLRPGGLTSADGRGRRTLQKVRLMHAAVRHLAGQAPQWRAEFDLPINQEDLAGTLMSFSWVAIDGLRRLGIELNADEQAAYLHCWQVVGAQLGITEELIPGDVESAKALAGAFQRRQYAPSGEGVEMTQALVKAMQYELPGNLLDPLPPVFISYFLGADYARMLGIEESALAGILRAPLSLGGALLSDLNHDCSALADVAEKVSRLLIQSTLLTERGGNRPAFSIPAELKQQWGVNWLA